MLSFLPLLFITFAAAGPIEELPPICEGDLTVSYERPPTWVDDVSCDGTFAVMTLEFDNDSDCDTHITALSYEVEVRDDVAADAFIESAFLTSRRGWTGDDVSVSGDAIIIFADDPLFIVPAEGEARVTLMLTPDLDVCRHVDDEASVIVTFLLDDLTAERVGRPVEDIVPSGGVLYGDWVVVRSRPFRLLDE